MFVVVACCLALLRSYLWLAVVVFFLAASRAAAHICILYLALERSTDCASSGAISLRYTMCPPVSWAHAAMTVVCVSYRVGSYNHHKLENMAHDKAICYAMLCIPYEWQYYGAMICRHVTGKISYQVRMYLHAFVLMARVVSHCCTCRVPPIYHYLIGQFRTAYCIDRGVDPIVSRIQYA